LPSSLVTIGDYGFENCSSLENINVAPYLTTIGTSCFKGNTNLKSINFCPNATSIGSSAFESSGLTGKVTLPKQLTVINGYVFNNCSGIVELVIPNTVTSLSGQSFGNCTGLKEVTIPISTMQTGAIGTTNIEKITFTKGTGSGYNYNTGTGTGTYLNAWTYYSRNALTEVVFEEGITSIGDFTFYQCNNLKTVSNIPVSLTSIGNSAFNGLHSSVVFKYKGTQTQWNAITKGSNNTSITSTNVLYNQ